MSDTRTLQKLKWQGDAAEITYGHAQPARPSKRRVSAMASATRFTGVGTREQTAGDGGVLCFCMQAGARTGGRAVLPCSAATCGGPSTTRIFFLAHAGGWSAAGPSALPVSISNSNSNDELGAGLNFESCSNSDKRIDLLLRILLFVWYGSIYFFLPKKDKRITILIFLLIYNVVILLEDDMKCIPLHEVIIRARAS